MDFNINKRFYKWGYLLWGFGNLYLAYYYLPPFLQSLMLSSMFFLIGLYLCGKFVILKEQESLEDKTKKIDAIMEAMKFGKKQNDNTAEDRD